MAGAARGALRPPCPGVSAPAPPPRLHRGPASQLSGRGSRDRPRGPPPPGYENHHRSGSQDSGTCGYGPSPWEHPEGPGGLSSGGAAPHPPEPRTDDSESIDSESIVAKIKQRLDMMSKEGVAGDGDEGLQEPQR